MSKLLVKLRNMEVCDVGAKTTRILVLYKGSVGRAIVSYRDSCKHGNCNL